MFDVLTPLNILHRRSFKISDISALVVANAGIWLQVDAAGKVENIAADVQPAVVKVAMSALSSNIYESHDVRGGRVITVLEGGMATVKMNEDAYAEKDGDDAAYTYTPGEQVSVGYTVGALKQVLAGHVGKVVPASAAVTGDPVVGLIESMINGVLTVNLYGVTLISA